MEMEETTTLPRRTVLKALGAGALASGVLPGGVAAQNGGDDVYCPEVIPNLTHPSCRLGDSGGQSCIVLNCICPSPEGGTYSWGAARWCVAPDEEWRIVMEYVWKGEPDTYTGPFEGPTEEPEICLNAFSSDQVGRFNHSEGSWITKLYLEKRIDGTNLGAFHVAGCSGEPEPDPVPYTIQVEGSPTPTLERGKEAYGCDWTFTLDCPGDLCYDEASVEVSFTGKGPRLPSFTLDTTGPKSVRVQPGTTYTVEYKRANNVTIGGARTEIYCEAGIKEPPVPEPPGHS